MNTLAALKNLEVTNGKVVLTALKPEQFADQPEILNRYFRNNNRNLDRFHAPALTEAEYTFEVSEMYRRPSPENCSLKTASHYFITKAQTQRIARDLGVRPSDISWEGYTWNEDYYQMSDFWTNQRWAEEKWRENGEDRSQITAWQAYVVDDTRTAVLPTELYEELFRFCLGTIRRRQAMLYCKVEQCIGNLILLSNSTYGFSVNPTAGQVAQLRGYKRYFLEILKDKDAKQYISEHKDYELFADPADPENSDYVYTYNKMLRLLASNSDSISYTAEMLKNPEDPYAEYLLTGTSEVEIDENSFYLTDNAQ